MLIDSDLIKRKDAIDALLKLGDSYFGEDEVRRGIAQSQRIIYELPSAESKAENLIKKIKQLEKFNNSDCPQWVINIIKGEGRTE